MSPVVARCALSVALLTSLAAGEVASQGPELRLADGTPLRIRLLHFISSETSKAGDPVRFEVVQDVVVAGATVITRGTPATGAILEAFPSTVMGRSGRLVFTINETLSVDGQGIRLRASPLKQDRTSGIVVAKTRSALLHWVAEGTPLDAFIDGEYTIRQPALPLQRGVPALWGTALSMPEPATDVMTNDDVRKLISAGVSDEVVIAKIRASRTAFRLQSDEIVRLRKAGVSNRVLTAMIEASRGARPRPKN